MNALPSSLTRGEMSVFPTHRTKSNSACANYGAGTVALGDKARELVLREAAPGRLPGRPSR